MSYFDIRGYAPQKSTADITEGLNNLGDALTDVLNRRQKAQQFQQQLDFENQDAARKFAQNQGNQDYQNRIIDQRDKRDQLTFNQGQEAHKRDATIAAAKAMADNNPELAKAIMHGTVTYDPATGAETGRGEIVPGPMKDVGPEPQAPVPPQAPQGVPPEIAARRRGLTSTSADPNDIYQRQGTPMPPQTGVDPTESFGRPKNFIPSGLTLTSDEGPVEEAQGGPPNNPAPGSVSSRGFAPDIQASREQATSDMAAEEQARMDQAQYGQQKTAFDAASAAYPAERARYDASRGAAERERPYTARFGANDPGVSFTPETQRYAHRQAAADDFVDSLHGVALDERGQQAAQAAHAAIMAGEDPQKVYKAFEAARTMGQTFDFKHGENQFHEQESDKRTAMMARAKGPQASLDVVRADEARAGGNRQDQAELRRDFSDWESKVAALPLDAKSFKRLEFAARNINSDNPLQQKEAAEGLVGFFRGGVTTASAQNFLLGHVSGLGGQAETAVEHVKSGKYGPQDLAVIAQAAKNAVTEQRDTAMRHAASAAVRFGPGSGFESLAPQVNAKVQGTLREFGVEVPPIYPDAGPAIPLGSTARPYQGQPKPAPRRGPPEIDARNRGKSKAALDEAMGQ